jgi:Transglutaminase-like superfamily
MRIGPRLSRSRFFRLTPADWWLLVAVTLAQITTAAALRAMPLPTLRSRASRLCRPAQFLVRGSDERIIWAIEATGRRLGRSSTCLLRALVAELLLDTGNGTICLTIGIRRTADNLDAHAWLARDGRVLIGAPADDYTPIVDWTSPSASRS